MTFSILWTTVPASRQPGNLLRLSLVASPRVEQTITQLGESALADWPRVVRAFGPLALQVSGQSGLHPLTRISPNPSSELWRKMLPDTTRVIRPAPGVRQLVTTPKESFVGAAEAIDEIYADTSVAAQVLAALRGLPDDGRVAAALPASARARGLQALDRMTGAELAAATQTLRSQGHLDAALALPIAVHAGALRTTAAPQSGAPALLDGVEKIGSADFHQRVGMLLDHHPVLAVAVGLRSDFTMSAAGLDQVRLIRVVRADGRPLDGPVPRPLPWSKVRLSADRFVMDTAGEVRDGLLEPTPEPARRYVVTGTDVTGVATHLLAAS